MRNVAVDSPIVDVDAKFFLLIPSRFPPVALFQRIAGGNHDAVAEIESLTNPRLQEKNRLLRARPDLDEKTPSLQNWNHAPFTYPNPEGSRFFGPETPCLELSRDIQTALAVSVAKREKFLSRTRQARINLDMRVLTRVVRGAFVNGEDWPLNLTTDDYRTMGDAVKKRNVDGVLFRSEERPSGARIAILSGKTLETAVQGDHYRYVWNGETVGSLYSFSHGVEIDPRDLGGKDLDIAA